MLALVLENQPDSPFANLRRITCRMSSHNGSSFSQDGASGKAGAVHIHTNGIESLWSMLKRAHKGTFHKLSPKHLNRYVQEFAGRHNLREHDTIDIMGAVACGMNGKRLRYRELIADNGLPSGARS